MPFTLSKKLKVEIIVSFCLNLVLQSVFHTHFEFVWIYLILFHRFIHRKKWKLYCKISHKGTLFVYAIRLILPDITMILYKYIIRNVCDRRYDPKVQRSPRMREIGVRSTVETYLCVKSGSDSSTAKCSTTSVSVMGPQIWLL